MALVLSTWCSVLCGGNIGWRQWLNAFILQNRFCVAESSLNVWMVISLLVNMELKLRITKPSILCTSCSGHYRQKRRQWYRNEEKWLNWSSSSNFSGRAKVLCPFHSSTKVSSPAINLIPRPTLVSKWIYIRRAFRQMSQGAVASRTKQECL